jgi:serine/threonine protein kinase
MYNRQTGDIKLIDFEIAKACRTPLERCEMWTNTGTLAYKAPEMFSSGYNELVDIWAIGVVAYELLAGKMPFLREFEKDTIMAIKNLEPEYPEWLPPAAGEFLTEVPREESPTQGDRPRTATLSIDPKSNT